MLGGCGQQGRLWEEGEVCEEPYLWCHQSGAQSYGRPARWKGGGDVSCGWGWSRLEDGGGGRRSAVGMLAKMWQCAPNVEGVSTEGVASRWHLGVGPASRVSRSSRASRGLPLEVQRQRSPLPRRTAATLSATLVVPGRSPPPIRARDLGKLPVVWLAP